MKNKIMEKFSIIDKRGQTLLTPFSINKEKKILYFHIAKTGGSTIVKILRENGLDDMVIGKTTSYETKLKYFEEVVEEWDQYYKFTFVRNKFDMLVSHWHYDGRPGKTFRNFIKNILAPNKDLYDYWIDQYYLTVIDNKSIFDFIGRYDNYKHDQEIVLTKIGIKSYNRKLKANKGHYNNKIHFSKYYDNELRDIVYKKFKNEIDYFKFDLGCGYENKNV